MNDDWRLQIDFAEDDHAQALTRRLDAQELEHELSVEFHDQVIVSREGQSVFIYAGTRDQAEAARDAIEADTAKNGSTVTVELRHWHPTAEEWEDPEAPLPDGDAAKLAEHEALMAREREEAAKRGHPEFEVRIDLPSHHDAVALSNRLRGEGLPTVHRWKYVLVGAADEDAGKALAERIRAEAPAGSEVKVEGTWAAAYGERPRNPFAIFGGLGG
jgi:hypothetical protein